jgi:hypothetical protein
MLLTRWLDMRGLQPSERTLIETPDATCYNDLYRACVSAKKKELELANRGGMADPFLEPSTFYGSFKDAHYHSDYTHAGSRLASSLHCYFFDYLNVKQPTLRFLRDSTKYSDMIDAANRAGGNAWLFLLTVSEATIPYYRMHDVAYDAMLEKYSKTENEFLKQYADFQNLVQKNYLWTIKPWEPIQEKKVFDLSKYSQERRALLEQAIECINSLMHFSAWEFIASDGLMKEYPSVENGSKAHIVDNLFSAMKSNDIFKNSWVIQEITALAKLAVN